MVVLMAFFRASEAEIAGRMAGMSWRGGLGQGGDKKRDT